MACTWRTVCDLFYGKHLPYSSIGIIGSYPLAQSPCVHSKWGFLQMGIKRVTPF